jgi:hypothetical protein
MDKTLPCYAQLTGLTGPEVQRRQNRSLLLATGHDSVSVKSLTLTTCLPKMVSYLLCHERPLRGFYVKILYVSLVSPFLGTYPAHHSLLDLTNVIILDDLCKLQSFLLRMFLILFVVH